MRRLSLLALAFAALLLAPRLALAGQAATGNITVDRAWSRATPGGAEVAAGYLTIVNHGDTPDRLVSVSTRSPGKTEIHQMKMADGKMEMRPVPDGIEIPANGTVALEPMGYHLMLMELKASIAEGRDVRRQPDLRACRHRRRHLQRRGHRSVRTNGAMIPGVSPMLLVLLRGLFVACALSGFGAALFAATLMKVASPISMRHRARSSRGACAQ